MKTLNRIISLIIVALMLTTSVPFTPVSAVADETKNYTLTIENTYSDSSLAESSAVGGVSFFSSVEFEGCYGNQLSGPAREFYDSLVKNYATDKKTGEYTYNFETPFTFNAEISGGSIVMNDELEEIQLELDCAMQAAMDAFLYDHPEVFWLRIIGSSYGVSASGNDVSGYTGIIDDITIIPTEIYSGASSKLSQYESAVDSVIDAITVTESRYDTLKNIHDYICNNAWYNLVSEQKVHSSEPFFIGDGGVVCEGYAKTFKVICDRLEIPCVLVSGNAGGAHMWNYVQMDDDKWYLVDATWDDQESRIYDTYFLANANTIGFDDVAISEERTERTDFSGTGIFSFTYPVLSTTAYTVHIHEWDSEYIVDVEPTCTEKGSKSIHCKFCYETKSVTEVPATNHANKTEYAQQDSTCTENGYTAGIYCLDCDVWLEGHDTIKVKAHNDKDSDNFCDICSDYLLSVVKTGKCGDNVYYKWYIDDTVIISGEGDMWDYISGRTSPFMFFYSNRTVKTLIIKRGVTSIGHGSFYSTSLKKVVLNEDVAVIKETAFGSCDYLTSVYYSGSADEWSKIKIYAYNQNLMNSKIYYDYCLESNSVTHKKSRSVAKQKPTCTQSGFSAGTYCDNCQKWISGHEVIEATGHSEKIDAMVPPTCTSTGLTEGKHCSLCSKVFVTQEIIPEKGHTEVHFEEEEPTCAKEGFTAGVYCPDCETWISGHKEIAVADHNWNEGVITSVSTCKNNGLKVYTCINDNTHYYTESIALDKNNHEGSTYIKDKKEATCLNDGYTGNVYCSGCDKIISQGQIIPMIEHKTVDGKCTLCNCFIVKRGEYLYLSFTTTVYKNVLWKCGDNLKIVSTSKSYITTGSYTKSTFSVTLEAVNPGKTYVKALNNGSAVITATVIAECVHEFKNYIFDDGPCSSGTKTSKCTYCNKIDVVSPKGHNYSSKVTKPATCTKKGTKTFVCICGDTYTETIAKLGHSYSSKYTVDKQPTYTQAGSKSRHCTRENCDAKTDITAIPKLVLAVPQNLKASSKNTTITLTWDKVDGAKGYRIYRYNNGWKSVKTTAATSYTVTGLTAGTSYRFAVKAYTKNGSTTIWAPKFSEIKTATAPVPPTTVKQTAGTDKTVTVKWDACKNATGYRVYKYNSSTKKWETVVKATTKLTAKISGLSANRQYYIAVKPYTKTESGYVWGTTFTKILVGTAPATPTVKLASTSKGRATIAWNDVAGEKGYQVYYSTSATSGFKKVSNYNADITKAYKTGLTSGKTYYFKVRTYRVYNGIYVYSPYSSVKSVKVK